MMSGRRLVILEDASAACVRAAEEMTHLAGESICSRGQFAICLAGGSTPKSAYELLATRFHLSVDWKEVQFFWGDERCVAPDDDASNFGMAKRAMLSKLEIRPDQIHRIRGEDEPEAAARAYEEDLREFFSLGDNEFPRFDLILLGLGANGHTASLFPRSNAIHETRRMAVATEVDDPIRHRVSLTFPAINNAARIIFLVCGTEKAAAVRDVLEGPKDPDRLPAQAIEPIDGEVIWILDRKAAALLSPR
jgi:6-phosphogluconolactonase